MYFNVVERLNKLDPNVVIRMNCKPPKCWLMLLITILYLLIGLNLIYIMSEKTTTVFRDIRFWLIMASLMILVVLTMQNYPG